jgi:hypothetical protein
MEIEVPVSSVATVFVPTGKLSKVKESGKEVSENPFVHEAGQEDDYAVYKVESGKYIFEVN